MIIDCISDLHGSHPELEGGDLLIVAGDLTVYDKPIQHLYFTEWLESLPYKNKVVVAGNHDNNIDPATINSLRGTYYLQDSGIEIQGQKIYGSPWTKTFSGMNPHCKAFTFDSENDLSRKWSLIPDDVDLLITHSPAYGILDRTIQGKCVGSKSLQMELVKRLRPKLFVCGHIHEAYGQEPSGGFVNIAINASCVNERYQPVNKPIRIVMK